ncbi:MAG TPA: FAD-dependent monooxygenase [Casimicrobiaceae bacterium]|nr:FAD-dependent monooxygenase [Casimicrobiaceae bacterium]
MSDTDVLIAGAGPTGLVLALWLQRLGVRVRIVDKVAEPGTTSRALVLHARTMELYHQIGIAEGVVGQALRFAAINLWVRGNKMARIALGDIGAGVSAYPYMLIFPQDQHERFLIERLRENGVRIDRPTEVLGFEERGDRVAVNLKHADGSDETCEAAFLAGCDGARSIVREFLHTGFPGGTYKHLFYVADVEATGPVMNEELHLALDEADFLAVFPMKGNERVRLIGTVEQASETQHDSLEWKDLSRSVIERLGIDVTRVNWFSTYHVHHRVAAHFRAGRTFLLGDAAHIHSPVGGQGMNTGIGDAANLAWKLAAVLQDRANHGILDTFEPERIAFAQRLVATTDRAFQLVISDGRLARFVRLHVVPRVLPVLFSKNITRRFMFRTVSQTAIEYRRSNLSAGVAGKIRGGDRLPWIKLGPSPGGHPDNFAPLASLDWQLHVYGDVAPAISGVCKAMRLPLHSFPWQQAMHSAGFVRGAVYLIRPDGYVGFADREANAAKLQQYLSDRQIRPREPS